MLAPTTGKLPRPMQTMMADLFPTHLRRKQGKEFMLLACCTVFILGSAAQSTAQDRVQITPAGRRVELLLNTSTAQKEYQLESKARLAEGEEWAPLLRFRASTSPRPYLDPICGTANARFFRLRQLLDAPPR